MKDASQETTTLLTEDDVRANEAGELSVTGFSVMCAWHFLTLFTAMPASGDMALEGRPFLLQLVLYFSLALSYGVLSFASGPLLKTLYHRGKRWSVTNLITGLFATAASAMAVLSIDAALPVRIVAYVLLGLSQALLMFPWLQLPSISNDKGGSYRNLGFNMGLGGLVAIVIGSLQIPLYHIGFCILPLIANVLVVVYWNRSRHVTNDDEEKNRLSLGGTIRANTHFIVYGIAFGLCQFMFSQAFGPQDMVSFALNTIWPLLGIVLSAVIVYLMPVRYFRIQGVFSAQRFGMVFFVTAIIVAVYLNATEGAFDEQFMRTGAYSSQALFLAGFNIFDFVFMTTSFTWAARLETDFAAYIGANRSVLYLSMGVGLGLGWLIGQYFMFIPAIPIAVSGLVIVVLCITTLPPFDDFAPYARIVTAERMKRDAEKAEAEREARAAEERVAVEKAKNASWSNRVNAIADEHELSKREREILFYLAKGRNAAFIQQELWISIHTVKTHIANIYRKLEVHSIQEVLDMVDNQADKGDSK